MRIISIQDDDYERQYQESMNYLNDKYHPHYTRLKNVTLTRAQQLALDTHGITNNITIPNNKPNGRRVI